MQDSKWGILQIKQFIIPKQECAEPYSKKDAVIIAHTKKNVKVSRKRRTPGNSLTIRVKNPLYIGANPSYMT